MPYTEGDLTFHLYGEDDSPLGAGQGAQSWDIIVDLAKSTGQRFEDPFFPIDGPCLEDIDLTDDDDCQLDVKWFRPDQIAKEMFGTEPIFHGEFTEFAINQGSTGDCWFLGSLADVALEPDCINSLVPPGQEAGFEAGAFHFRFWCRGKWVDIVVDDRLPCFMNDDGSIDNTVFCKPTADGEFWAALLEKAYAKMYGGKYINIDAGEVPEAMLDFTGGFVQDYLQTSPNAPDVPDYVSIIREAKKNHCLMALSTFPQSPPGKEAEHDSEDGPGDEGVSSEGVVAGHAYSLLDFKEVPHKDDHRNVCTLLKLRNPWGTAMEWNGAFSDTDDEGWATLTKDLRRKSEDKLEDGEFWVRFQDFVGYIENVTICNWRGMHRSSKTVDNVNGESCFVDFGRFRPKNSGPVMENDTEVYKNKKGYCFHLIPKHVPGKHGLKEKDGLKYSCAIAVDLMYLNYSRAGTNEDIPEFGFIALWSPGYTKPTKPKFFHKINFDAEIYEFQKTEKDRRISVQKHLPAGTVYILPWTTEPVKEETPFYIRICVDGRIAKF